LVDFNQAVCALRFLYGVTLRQPWPVIQIPFANQPREAGDWRLEAVENRVCRINELHHPPASSLPSPVYLRGGVASGGSDAFEKRLEAGGWRLEAGDWRLETVENRVEPNE